MAQVSCQLWDVAPALWWKLLGDACDSGVELQPAHISEVQVCACVFRLQQSLSSDCPQATAQLNPTSNMGYI